MLRKGHLQSCLILSRQQHITLIGDSRHAQLQKCAQPKAHTSCQTCLAVRLTESNLQFDNGLTNTTQCRRWSMFIIHCTYEHSVVKSFKFIVVLNIMFQHTMNCFNVWQASSQFPHNHKVSAPLQKIYSDNHQSITSQATNQISQSIIHQSSISQSINEWRNEWTNQSIMNQPSFNQSIHQSIPCMPLMVPRSPPSYDHTPS